MVLKLLSKGRRKIIENKEIGQKGGLENYGKYIVNCLSNKGQV